MISTSANDRLLGRQEKYHYRWLPVNRKLAVTPYFFVVAGAVDGVGACWAG